MKTRIQILRGRHRALSVLLGVSHGVLVAATAFAAFVHLRPASVVTVDRQRRVELVEEARLPIDKEDAAAFVRAFVRARAVPFSEETHHRLARADGFMSAGLRRLETQDPIRREARETYQADAEARHLRAKLHADQTTCRRHGPKLWACELKGQVAAIADDRPEGWIVVLRAFAEEVTRTRKSPYGLLLVHYDLGRERIP